MNKSEPENWREQLRKVYKSDNDQISFFPYGGDEHDFDVQNCEKFISQVEQEALERGRNSVLDEMMRMFNHYRVSSPVDSGMMFIPFIPPERFKNFIINQLNVNE